MRCTNHRERQGTWVLSTLLLATRNRGRMRFMSLPGQTLDLHGMTTDGMEWDIKDHRGKVIVLYFYYAGAGVPVSVKEVYETYQERLVVVGLNLDNTKKDRSVTTNVAVQRKLSGTFFPAASPSSFLNFAIFCEGLRRRLGIK